MQSPSALLWRGCVANPAGTGTHAVNGDELGLGEPCQVRLSLIPCGDTALTTGSWGGSGVPAAAWGAPGVPDVLLQAGGQLSWILWHLLCAEAVAGGRWRMGAVLAWSGVADLGWVGLGNLLARLLQTQR